MTGSNLESDGLDEFDAISKLIDLKARYGI